MLPCCWLYKREKLSGTQSSLSVIPWALFLSFEVKKALVRSVSVFSLSYYISHILLERLPLFSDNFLCSQRIQRVPLIPTPSPFLAFHLSSHYHNIFIVYIFIAGMDSLSNLVDWRLVVGLVAIVALRFFINTILGADKAPPKKIYSQVEGILYAYLNAKY